MEKKIKRFSFGNNVILFTLLTAQYFNYTLFRGI